MIPAVIERCAGIDVGKQLLTVCIMVGPADAQPSVQTKKFGTFNFLRPNHLFLSLT